MVARKAWVVVSELNSLLDKKASEKLSEEKPESSVDAGSIRKKTDVGHIDNIDADLGEYLELKLPLPTESESEASIESPSSVEVEDSKTGTRTIVSLVDPKEKPVKHQAEEIEPSMPMHMRQTQAMTPDAEFNEVLYSSFDITPSASGTIGDMPQMRELPIPQAVSAKENAPEETVEKQQKDNAQEVKMPTVAMPASKVLDNQVPAEHAEIPTPPLTSSDKPLEAMPSPVADKMHIKLKETPDVSPDPRDHPPETDVDVDDAAKPKRGSSLPAVSQPSGLMGLSETNEAPDVYIANMGEDGEMVVKAPSIESESDSLSFDNKGGGSKSEGDLEQGSQGHDAPFSDTKTGEGHETPERIHFAEEKVKNAEDKHEEDESAGKKTATDKQANEDEDEEYYEDDLDDEDDGYYDDDEDEDDAFVETEGEDEVVTDDKTKSQKAQEDGSKASPETETKETVPESEKTDAEKQSSPDSETVQAESKEKERVHLPRDGQEKPLSVEDSILKKRQEESAKTDDQLLKERVNEELLKETEEADESKDVGQTEKGKEKSDQDGGLPKDEIHMEKVPEEDVKEDYTKETVDEPQQPSAQGEEKASEDASKMEESKSQSDAAPEAEGIIPTEIVNDGTTTLIVDGTTIIDYDSIPPPSVNLEPSEQVLISPSIEATPVMPSPSIEIAQNDLKATADSGIAVSKTLPSSTSTVPENDTLHSASPGLVEPQSMVGLGSADYVTREFVSRKPLQDSFPEPDLGEPKVEEPKVDEPKVEEPKTEEPKAEPKDVDLGNEGLKDELPEKENDAIKPDKVQKPDEVPEEKPADPSTEKLEADTAEKLPIDDVEKSVEDASATPTVDPALDADHQPWIPEDMTPTPPTLQDDVPQEPPLGDPGIEKEAGAELQDPAQQASMVSTILVTLDGSIMQIVDMLPASVIAIIHKEPFGLPPSLAFVVACSSMSILFIMILCTCGSSGGGGVSKVQLANIAKLEEQVFVLTKEKEALEQTVANNSNQGNKVSKQVAQKDRELQEKVKMLETVQLHNNSLQEITQKQKESIDSLGEQLEAVQSTLNTREEEYHHVYDQYHEMANYAKTLEDQLQQEKEKIQSTLGQSQASALDLQSQVQALTEEISILQTSKDRLLLEAEGWNEKVQELTEQVGKLEEDQRQYQDALAYKDNEIDVLKDCFVQLKAFETLAEKDSADGEENEEDEDIEKKVSKEDLEQKIAAMIDVSKVQTELKSIQEEKDTLQQRLQIEIEGRKELEDQVQHLKEEAQRLRQGHLQAEKQSQEAATKLNVLAQYFKEKEIEMQKSLGEQEVLKKQSDNKLKSADEIQEMLETEMSSNRQQVEDLKKEIEKAERDFRTQIATHEKKAHENWLTARQAERELKQSRSEAAALRQKLVELEMELRERRDGPPGLIRPLATRGMPPGMMNGPPPPDMRPGSRGSGAPLPPPSPHLRDSPRDMRRSPNDRRPYPPPDRPLPPPGRDRFPPPPPHPLDRLPPDARPTPPPYDRRPPPPGGVASPPPPFRDHRGPPPPHDLPPMRRSTSPHRRTPPDYPPPPFLRGGPPPPGSPPPGRPFPPGDAPPPPWEARPGSRNNGSMKSYPPRTSSPVHNGPGYPHPPPPAGRSGLPSNGPPPNDGRPQNRHQSFV